MARSPSRTATRRITLNVPANVLATARRETGKGITETVIEGLEILMRRNAGKRLLALAGKLELDIDIDESRGRRRH